MPEYLDKLQLLAFFLISYLLSRVFVRFEVPRRLIYWLFQEKKLTVSRLTWLIILGSAVLSMLIANIVTLLTLIPVLVMLQKDYHGPKEHQKRFSSLIMLSAIWGANIGGMGMLTGTPANGLLVAMLELYKLGVKGQFTFLSWMAWGFPLAILLCVLGWAVLKLVLRPGHYFGNSYLKPGFDLGSAYKPIQNVAFVLAGVFLLSSSLLSFAMSYFKSYQIAVLVFTGAWTVVMLYLLFLHPFKISGDGQRGALLRRMDILHELPRKGFLWVLIGLAFSGLLIWLKFPSIASAWAAQWITSERWIILLMLTVALITTFLTEIVSNTVVLTSMFVALFPLTRSNPLLTWQIMLIISLSSNCAFMSPLATPCNGLGFGSSHKISLRFMLLAGLVMNLSSAALITLWVHYVVPPVLAMFA